MLNLSVIGTSGITEKFLSAARKTGRFKFHTVYSRTAEKGRAFAEKQGFEGFCTDINALAKDSATNAVYIASPNSCHFAQSKLFLQNGKHVFCEKPIVTKAAEYDELLSLADKSGLIYAEAIMSRHFKGREKLLEGLSQIGNISVARINCCQRSSRYDAFMAGEHMNIFDMSLCAGTLMDLGVYCVYAAVDMFGMPKNIKACASFFENGADKSGSAIFEYDGFTAVFPGKIPGYGAPF